MLMKMRCFVDVDENEMFCSLGPYETRAYRSVIQYESIPLKSDLCSLYEIDLDCCFANAIVLL